jgi:tetratricopeptide (TPR) repeat protein
VKAAIAAGLAGVDDADEDDLTIASNAAADLVRAGKLDEAEQAARDLLVLFPDVHDGYDRLGMVYEARGENRQAADCYRKVIAFIREHADDNELGFEDTFVTRQSARPTRRNVIVAALLALHEGATHPTFTDRDHTAPPPP